MVWLGEISYEIFLLHVLVMALVLGVMLRWPLFTGSLLELCALTLLVTIPLALALRRLTTRSAGGKKPGRASVSIPGSSIENLRAGGVTVARCLTSRSAGHSIMAGRPPVEFRERGGGEIT